jgi:hypothetical protein
LNAYFDAMSEPIERHGGEILKFIGDGLLAIFPLSQPSACANLLRAVAEARKAMIALNEKNSETGRDPSGKQKFRWDRGFGVRCSGKTNGKSYVVQHDLPNGRARRITVGSANVFTIAEAKVRAQNAKQVATTLTPHR